MRPILYILLTASGFHAGMTFTIYSLYEPEVYEPIDIPTVEVIEMTPTKDEKIVETEWIRDAGLVRKRFDKWIEDPNTEGLPVGLAEMRDGSCTIYAFEPDHLNDERGFEILGHELYHCFRGHFHE